MKKIEIVLSGKNAEELEDNIARYVSQQFMNYGFEGNSINVKDVPAVKRDIMIPEFLKDRKKVTA